MRVSESASERGKAGRLCRGPVGCTVVAVVLSLGLAAMASAQGAQRPSQHHRSCDRWTGATSERWDVRSNWSVGVPTAQKAVCIDVGAHRSMAVLDGKGAAREVSIGSGAQLLIGTKGNLTVGASVRVTGTLTFQVPTARVRTPFLKVTTAGTMAGVGTVFGNVVNEGRVLAVDGGTGTPLRVSRSYRQAASAMLLLRYEAGRFVELRAGSASLAGRLEPLILDALTPGSSYKFVVASTLSGRFDHVVRGYVLHYRHRVVRGVVTPQIQLAHSRVRRGGKVAVFGESFGYLGIVRFHFGSKNGPQIGSANVNSIGGFEGFAHIPANAKPGRHLIVAVRPPLGYTAKAMVVVAGG